MGALIVPRGTRPWLAAAGLMCLVALTVTGAFPWLGIRPLALEASETDAIVVLRNDVRTGQYGSWAIAELGDVPVFLQMEEGTGSSGDRLHVRGTVEPETVTVGGRPYQIIDVETIENMGSSASGYQRMGKALRSRVQVAFAGGDENAALLAGFLVGDVSGVTDSTQDAMKLAGLSHFVAVSGSNVALYLTLVTFVAFPIGVGVRRRALIGLLLLPVFVVATGFEPSVMRASVMATIVLIGKLFDLGLEFFQVLSLAIVGLLIFDPWLIRSVGFQLSAMATAGVVVGSRIPGLTHPVVRAGAITAGAQLAVAPILLVQFGSLPLLSPLSNLVAAPIVSLATILAVPGVFGFDLAAQVAERLAGLVIQLAHTAAVWPQIGWRGLIVALFAGLGTRLLWNRSREAASVIVAFAVLVAVVPGTNGLDPGTVVVLDIGQGDAILIVGGDGRFALVDGGADEAMLLRRLRSFGVRQLDLVVVTHGDADHAGGLAALPGRIPVGQVWEQTEPHRSVALDRFIELAGRYRIPVVGPPVGESVRFGELTFRVVGPTRRYQSPNDQSIVILVSGSERSILLTGDIEAVAQRELPRLQYDILKVPHHGGGTSDEQWIAANRAPVAVISVGENRFGHPVDWVISSLEETGARVERTDVSGSIVLDLNE